MAKVVVCETMLKPSIVPMASESKADGTYYEVIGATIFNDAVCECPGFQFRGKCKHVALIAENRCDWHVPNPQKQYERCPVCHHPAVLFELDPELE